MKIRYNHLLMSLAMAAIVLLISACSQTIAVPGTGGASSLTPLQVIQNSANTMKQLKSSHIEFQSTNNVQTTGSTATPVPSGSSAPPAGSTPTLQNISVSIRGSGDQALPNMMQMHLTLSGLNQTANLAEIVQDNKVYVQNNQGQWFVLDKSNLQQYVGNPFAGLNIDQNSLLGLIQHANIIDHGTETLNGQNLRHIEADLDKTALRQLLSENPDVKNMLGQQNIDTLLNNTKSFTSAVDVWIDESKFYVHRSQFRLNLTADTSGLGSSAPSTVSINLNSIVDLSKFNEPVTIMPPTNATPTNNPGAIFGIGKP